MIIKLSKKQLPTDGQTDGETLIEMRPKICDVAKPWCLLYRKCSKIRWLLFARQKEILSPSSSGGESGEKVCPWKDRPSRQQFLKLHQREISPLLISSQETRVRLLSVLYNTTKIYCWMVYSYRQKGRIGTPVSAGRDILSLCLSRPVSRFNSIVPIHPVWR